MPRTYRALLLSMYVAGCTVAAPVHGGAERFQRVELDQTETRQLAELLPTAFVPGVLLDAPLAGWYAGVQRLGCTVVPSEVAVADVLDDPSGSGFRRRRVVFGRGQCAGGAPARVMQRLAYADGAWIVDEAAFVAPVLRGAAGLVPLVLLAERAPGTFGAYQYSLLSVRAFVSNSWARFQASQPGVRAKQSDPDGMGFTSTTMDALYRLWSDDGIAPGELGAVVADASTLQAAFSEFDQAGPDGAFAWLDTYPQHYPRLWRLAPEAGLLAAIGRDYFGSSDAFVGSAAFANEASGRQLATDNEGQVIWPSPGSVALGAGQTLAVTRSDGTCDMMTIGFPSEFYVPTLSTLAPDFSFYTLTSLTTQTRLNVTDTTGFISFLIDESGVLSELDHTVGDSAHLPPETLARELSSFGMIPITNARNTVTAQEEAIHFNPEVLATGCGDVQGLGPQSLSLRLNPVRFGKTEVLLAGVFALVVIALVTLLPLIGGTMSGLASVSGQPAVALRVGTVEAVDEIIPYLDQATDAVIHMAQRFRVPSAFEMAALREWHEKLMAKLREFCPDEPDENATAGPPGYFVREMMDFAEQVLGPYRQGRNVLESVGKQLPGIRLRLVRKIRLLGQMRARGVAGGSFDRLMRDVTSLSDAFGSLQAMTKDVDPVVTELGRFVQELRDALGNCPRGPKPGSRLAA